MSEIQNNELFERDEETNALIPVVSASASGEKETRNGKLHIRDAETNALIPVVHIRNEAGGGGVFPLIDIIYPVGIVIAFTNVADPNALYAGTAWQKLPDDTFLRSKAIPGGTGGSNTVTQILSHTHTLGVITVPSAGAHAHNVEYRGWSDGNGGVCRSAGGVAGSVASASAGAHTHTIPAGTTVPAPAGAVASVDNQPQYLDVAYWTRTA
jgi:hypothetical protein